MPGSVCLASSATRLRTACRSLSPSFIRPSSAKATSGSSGAPVMTGSSAHRPPPGNLRLSMWRFRGRHPSGGRCTTVTAAGTGAVPFTGAGSLPPGGGSHRTPAYPPPSRNGYPGRRPAARLGSRARLLEGTVTSPARPDPAHTPSGYDHVRPSPARSGACNPAQFSAGTLVLHIGTLPSRGTWAARGRSGPPAAQRTHPAGSRT
jgi:hypothetical protein